jgi:hypothetical protein
MVAGGKEKESGAGHSVETLRCHNSEYCHWRTKVMQKSRGNFVFLQSASPLALFDCELGFQGGVAPALRDSCRSP